MIGLGLILFAIGVGDLVAGGLAGEPRSREGAAAGLGFAVLVVGAGGSLLGLGLGACVAATALVALGVGAWLFLRVRQPLAERAAWWALTALGALLLVCLGASHLWQGTPGVGFTTWLKGLPLRLPAEFGLGEIALLTGVLMILSATSNGIVRAVLTISGTPAQRSESRLRGGRLIGPLERFLIFGLALSGEPTAAALIVSAKSILRFPELSRKVASDPSEGPIAEVDFVTEYFLLGSLVSWLAALSPVVLFPR